MIQTCIFAEKKINVSPQETDDHNLQLHKQLIVKLVQSLHKTTWNIAYTETDNSQDCNHTAKHKQNAEPTFEKT